MALRHAGRIDVDVVAGVAGLLTAALLYLTVTDGDAALARAVFFDGLHARWRGRHEWWAEEFLHTGGRNTMRLVGILAIITWAMSHFRERLTPHRAALGYFAACMVVVPLTVGLLKQVTNVDCPWDLQGFGGTLPVVHWFEARPPGLPHAACFPGAHSSSAFALFSLYFVWRPTRPRWARWALWGTVLLGALFSVAQQSRGAHFMSHDIASALIAWSICFALTRPASTNPHPTR
jgi:membrane-associated PAP2 superfamily phosphatase